MPLLASGPGYSIDAHWVPPPAVIAAEYDEMAGRLNQMYTPLRLSQAAFIEGIDRIFDEEGPGWQELSPQYAKERGSEHPILEVSGEMHAGLTSDGSYNITARELFFTGAAAPQRWEWHQKGYSNQKATVPARPMVDMTAETEAEILDIWDQWVGGIIGGFYTHGGGTTQMRTKSGLGNIGSFGPKVGRIGR